MPQQSNNAPLSTIEKVFLGWDQAVLWSLIDWIKNETSSSFDYSDYIIISPSKRAQSRISELLILDAKESGKSILSPKFYSSLTTCLSDFRIPQAKSPITISESLIAWEVSIKAYQKLETPNTFISGEHLASYLEQLRKDLLSHNLKIDDVISSASSYLSESQLDLCKELSVLNNLYEETLEEFGFYDDLKNIEIAPPNLKYLFVGCLSLNPLENHLIEKFRLNCFNLIGAPSTESESFLADGSLDASVWANKPSPIKINIVANPFVEIDSIKAMIKSTPAEQICLSILDETLIGPLQTSLLADKINALPLGSKPFTNSLWGSWVLALIGLSLEGAERIRAFFEHPITSEILLKKEGPAVLEILDKLITISAKEIESLEDLKAHLPKTEAEKLLEILNFTFTKLERASSIEDYSKSLIDKISLALSSLTNVDQAEEVLVIIKELNALLNSPLSKHPLDLQNFYSLLRDRLINIDSTHQLDNSIPIIGWQETYLDDASTIVISDCIEGKLPSYPAPDPIITEQIKETLGLPTRDLYSARDNFILNYLIHSKDRTLFLAPKESTSGDFNKLSKLCLNGLSDIDFKETLNKFYGSKHTSIDKIGGSKLNKINPLPIPPNTPYEEFPLPSKAISPSQIRDYLTCPYHFYLKHILGIRESDYTIDELPSHNIGQILHEVFARVGKQVLQERPSSKSDLLKMGNQILDRLIAPYLRNKDKGQIYALQSSYLRTKVESYIDYEWETLQSNPNHIQTEIVATDFLEFPLRNGEIIQVKGRIDRIEEFEDKIRIVDFKTGDSPLKISQCFRNGMWLDPQLPLYGMFARSHFAGESNKRIEMQLVNFSKSPDTSNQVAELNTSDIDSVINLSELVVTSILNADFFPPVIFDSPILRRLAGDLGGIF